MVCALLLEVVAPVMEGIKRPARSAAIARAKSKSVRQCARVVF